VSYTLTPYSLIAVWFVKFNILADSLKEVFSGTPYPARQQFHCVLYLRGCRKVSALGRNITFCHEDLNKRTESSAAAFAPFT
jgi:hypothetical protein